MIYANGLHLTFLLKLVCNENNQYKKYDALTFKWTTYVGDLCCLVENYPSLTQNGRINEVHWEGAMDNSFQPRHVPPIHSTIVYKYCKNPPFYVEIYNAKILCKSYQLRPKHASTLAHTIILFHLVIAMN
jgi:hypothetical protein